MNLYYLYTADVATCVWVSIGNSKAEAHEKFKAANPDCQCVDSRHWRLVKSGTLRLCPTTAMVKVER